MEIILLFVIIGILTGVYNENEQDLYNQKKNLKYLNTQHLDVLIG